LPVFPEIVSLKFKSSRGEKERERERESEEARPDCCEAFLVLESRLV
jgi:hypothetical protein